MLLNKLPIPFTTSWIGLSELPELELLSLLLENGFGGSGISRPPGRSRSLLLLLPLELDSLLEKGFGGSGISRLGSPGSPGSSRKLPLFELELEFSGELLLEVGFQKGRIRRHRPMSIRCSGRLRASALFDHLASEG
jgi:hypothetical protein